MNNKIKIIVSFLLGAIIFSGVGVYAATKYLASEIEFTPTNENWKVNNIEDALNDLYEKDDNSIKLQKGKYINHWPIKEQSIPYGVDQSSTIVVNSNDVSTVTPYHVRVYGINDLFDDNGTVIYEKTSGGWGGPVSLTEFQSQYKYFVFINLYTIGYGYSLQA